jgi:nickel/cobalt exporter
VKKWLVLPITCLVLALPATAVAHPLGNFTINRYSRVDVRGDRIYVVYVLDMAEIPTFRERQRINDEEAYERAVTDDIGRRLDLRVGGQRLRLRPVRHALAFPPGVGGLKTMRLQAVYASAPLPARTRTSLAFRDGNFAGRIGWREVVVRATNGAAILSSTAPAKSISGELLAYPKDLLSSPPAVASARARILTGSRSGPPPALFSDGELGARVAVRAGTDSGFASLIAKDDLSAGFVLLSLAIALFWGAAHALSPGHGKAIIGAYLVGSRGTARHAFLLGGIVTVTHTVGVFALGLVTLTLSEFVLPEDLYPWLNLVSALMVVGVGLAVLRWRFSEWRHARAHARGVPHHHHHDHDHDHDHVPPPGSGLRGLVGVGISGGIIPCPTALVVLLAAVSLHRVGYGLVLIVAFSLGLAATITGIGLLAVSAKRVFGRLSLQGPLIRLLPAVSAVVVLALGVAMTVRAVPDLV